jgi:hypothetical protein
MPAWTNPVTVKKIAARRLLPSCDNPFYFMFDVAGLMFDVEDLNLTPQTSNFKHQTSFLGDVVFLFQAVQEVHVAFGEVRAFFRFHVFDGLVDFSFDVVRQAAVG